MPVTMVDRGTTLVEGPRRRIRDTGLGVVGCQVMVKALQAGTTCFRVSAVYSTFHRRIPRVVVATNTTSRVRCGTNTYLVQRTSDGVTGWLANRGVLCSGEAGEEGNDGDLGEHVDDCWYYVINA
jgi:hypothetical protein